MIGCSYIERLSKTRARQKVHTRGKLISVPSADRVPIVVAAVSPWTFPKLRERRPFQLSELITFRRTHDRVYQDGTRAAARTGGAKLLEARRRSEMPWSPREVGEVLLDRSSPAQSNHDDV
jgi:hypothetical protein